MPSQRKFNIDDIVVYRARNIKYDAPSFKGEQRIKGIIRIQNRIYYLIRVDAFALIGYRSTNLDHNKAWYLEQKLVRR